MVGLKIGDGRWREKVVAFQSVSDVDVRMMGRLGCLGYGWKRCL